MRTWFGFSFRNAAIAATAGLLVLCAAASRPPPASAGKLRCGPTRTKPQGLTALEPTLRGDIDGDGRDDSVFIAFGRHAPMSCRYRLVVQHSRRTSSFVVRADGLVRASAFSPSLNALANITSSARSDVIVTVDNGATIRSVAIFGMTRGRLEMMKIRAVGLHNAISYGASGAGISAIDCLGGRGTGRIVFTQAERWNRHWRIDRMILKARGNTFIIRKRKVTIAETLPSFPEFGTGRSVSQARLDFHSCRSAIADRAR